MITVGRLKEVLSILKDDIKVFAHNGEDVGIVFVGDAPIKQIAFIRADESEDQLDFFELMPKTFRKYIGDDHGSSENEPPQIHDTKMVKQDLSTDVKTAELERRIKELEKSLSVAHRMCANLNSYVINTFDNLENEFRNGFLPNDILTDATIEHDRFQVILSEISKPE